MTRLTWHLDLGSDDVDWLRDGAASTHVAITDCDTYLHIDITEPDDHAHSADEVNLDVDSATRLRDLLTAWIENR